MARNTSYQITDEGAEIKILAPQVKLEDVAITTSANQLTVEIPENDFTGKVKYVENFSSLLELSESKANLKDGVLTINIPYAESKKPKRIDIT